MQVKEMIDNKTALLIVGAIVVIMGVLGIAPYVGLPNLGMGTEPMWHAALKIIVGLAAVGIAMMNK